MKTLSHVILLILLTAGIATAQNEPGAAAPNPGQGGPPHHRIGMGPMPEGMPGLPELGHDWWRNSELAQAINLTDPQKQRLNDIFAKHRPTLVTSRGNVEIEEGKLRDLLEQDQPQQDQVMTEMTQLQGARNALEKEFTLMTLEFRTVLSPDQWKQLQTLTRQRMMRHFMRQPAPGGDAGPPPL